jgi:hypothetical protein
LAILVVGLSATKTAGAPTIGMTDKESTLPQREQSLEGVPEDLQAEFLSDLEANEDCGSEGADVIEHVRERRERSRRSGDPNFDLLEIPVRVISLYYGDYGIKDDETYFEDTVALTNKAFRGNMNPDAGDVKINFKLDSVKFVENYDLFWYCGLKEDRIKAKFITEPEKYIYVFSCFTKTLQGWASFPVSYPEDSGSHGVFLGYNVWAGKGGYQGNILVHELGHYFGLYHTFEGKSCDGAGDYVDDTPQQSESPRGGGCLEERDTCPDKPGVEAIYNFMNYVPDSCSTEFTPGQAKRMRAELEEYRPTLLRLYKVDEKSANNVVVSTTKATTTVSLPQIATVSKISCDDLPDRFKFKFGNKDVCGASKIKSWKKCDGQKTLPEAVGVCEARGARLCTREEIIQDVTRSTGCSLDNKLVWTSTTCTTDSGSQGFYTVIGASRFRKGDATKDICVDVSTVCGSDEPDCPYLRCCGDAVVA